jgi:hypothetical protein
VLGGTIDVMVTADPAVIQYAESRPRLATFALPWEKTYVLLSTSRILDIQNGGMPGAMPSHLSDGLARDAVRGDARGYRPPSWWSDLKDCRGVGDGVPGLAPPPGAYAPSGEKRILYDKADPIARGLVERIVALAAADPTASPEGAAIAAAVPGLGNAPPGVTAEGVTIGTLTRRLRQGDEFAYVLPIRRRPSDPCYEASELMNRAPWLAALGSDFPEALVPLVDTRSHVIVRKDRVGLMVDWYGNVLVAREK